MNSNDDNDGVMIDGSTKESKAVPLTGKIIFILICACNMIQNAIVGGSNNAIMTTLESGFYMTSTETGLFQSVYELVAIFTYPLVGYFGDRSGRKVRWIAVSMAILACGFCVMSIPHLMESKRGKPPLNPREADHLTLCNPNRNISVCTISNNLRFLSHLKYVFYLSNIINACGSAALPTLAVTLVEDIFPQEKAPIAQGNSLSPFVSPESTWRLFLCFRYLLCVGRHWHRPRVSGHLTVFESLHAHQEATLAHAHLFGVGGSLVARVRLGHLY